MGTPVFILISQGFYPYLESCPSGRRGAIGNRVYRQKRYRGFESLTLRHEKAAQGAVSHAIQRCEPRQARKGAAVSGTLYVYVRHGLLCGLFP